MAKIIFIKNISSASAHELIARNRGGYEDFKKDLDRMCKQGHYEICENSSVNFPEYVKVKGFEREQPGIPSYQKPGKRVFIFDTHGEIALGRGGMYTCSVDREN